LQKSKEACYFYLCLLLVVFARICLFSIFEINFGSTTRSKINQTGFANADKMSNKPCVYSSLDGISLASGKKLVAVHLLTSDVLYFAVEVSSLIFQKSSPFNLFILKLLFLTEKL
jgi:hypothetical protein